MLGADRRPMNEQGRLMLVAEAIICSAAGLRNGDIEMKAGVISGSGLGTLSMHRKG